MCIQTHTRRDTHSQTHTHMHILSLCFSLTVRHKCLRLQVSTPGALVAPQGHPHCLFCFLMDVDQRQGDTPKIYTANKTNPQRQKWDTFYKPLLHIVAFTVIPDPSCLVTQISTQAEPLNSTDTVLFICLARFSYSPSKFCFHLRQR